jgi:hypothetical protein
MVLRVESISQLKQKNNKNVMSKSTKSVTPFTIKKGTFDLNEYNKSYSNSPLYSYIDENLKELRSQLTIKDDVVGYVMDDMYDTSDIRNMDVVETYYIVGEKDDFNVCDIRKPMLGRMISSVLLQKFNQYLSETLYNLGNEEHQKLCDSLDIVYGGGGNNIHKCYRLVDTLYWEYNNDESLESHSDVRSKLMDGWKESTLYKDWLEYVYHKVKEKYDITKEFGEGLLLTDYLKHKKEVFAGTFSRDYESLLERYLRDKKEISDLETYLETL